MPNNQSNLSNEEIENQLNNLWKLYAQKFNRAVKSNYDVTEKELDELLEQIRNLEKLLRS